MVIRQQLLNANLSQWLCLTQSNPAEVVPSADNATPTRVNILAYTGGLVQLENLPLPVVFDLTSTKAASSVIMLYGHDRKVPIGHFDSVKISPLAINVSGALSLDNEQSRTIRDGAKNKYPWQASVGIQSNSISYVAEGKTVQVNGQTFTGPIYIARENLLREVSILTIGADPNTVVSLSANLGKIMTYEAWLAELGFDAATLNAQQNAKLKGIYDTMMTAGATDVAKTEAKASAIALKATWTQNPPNPNVLPVPPPTVPPVVSPEVARLRAEHAAEQTRISTIEAHARTYGNPMTNGVAIQATAIRDGWTVDQAEVAMLRAARPVIQHGPARVDGITPFQLLNAALHQTLRIARPTLESTHTPQVLETAQRQYRSRLSLQQLLYEAAVINGYTGSVNVKANLPAILRAAFSTNELVTIFTNTANLKLLEGYNQVDQSWREIADIGTADNFQEYTSVRVTGSANFQKIGPDGMIPHGRLAEGTFGNKVDTYAIMYALTRTDIYNDSLGAYDALEKIIGRGGALGLVRAFWVEFMNNAAFFAAGNGNVSTGALSIAGLSAAETVFRQMKATDGNYLMATPKILLVPNVLMPLAEQLYTDRNVLGGSTVAPASNPNAGKFRPVTSPYLSDSTITGNSTTAYYLLADPRDIPTIQVAFLDGQQTPIIETADVDFNQLGIQLRGYWDWGIRKQDPKGGVRSTGV